MDKSLSPDAWPQFDSLFVVSDLHLGGDKTKNFPQIFHLGNRFKLFIEHLLKERKPEQRTALLINGDTVDFLAESTDGLPDKYFDPDGALDKLKRIVEDTSFQPVWESLIKFVRTENCHLIFTIGNHDLELALPDVQEWLLNHLTEETRDLRLRITLAMHGEGFRCRVGNSRVYAVHGNDVDEWNVTDYEQLRRHARNRMFGRSKLGWTPNAGTQLVIDVMNKIKTHRPFVDLLKPEIEAVLPALAAMLPVLTGIGSLAQGGVAYGKTFYDRVRNVSDLLQGEQAPTEVQPLAVPMRGDFDLVERPSREEFARIQLGRVHDQIQRGATAWDLLPAQTDLATLGFLDAFGSIVSTYWGRMRHKPPAEALWLAIKELATDRSFNTRERDTTYEKINQHIADDYDFVLTGHTHLERAFERDVKRIPRGVYFNSGTWVRRIQLTPAMLATAEAFRPVYEALCTKTLDELDKFRLKSPDDETDRPIVVSCPAVVSIQTEAEGVVGQLFYAKEDDNGVFQLEPVKNSRFVR